MNISLKQVTSVELESEKSIEMLPNCLFISILSQLCEVRITLTYYFRNKPFRILLTFASRRRHPLVYEGDCSLEKCLL